MRLVWRGSVIVALLAVALGISWLPWRDLFTKDWLRGSAGQREPSVIEATAAPADGGAQASTPTPSPSTSPSARVGAPEAAAAADKTALRQVVALVNVEREAKGCGAVRVDARLEKAAGGHSADMARRSYFSHNTPEGVDPWQRAATAGYPKPTGENIALGFPDARTVMAGWMKSEGHRNNILNCTSRLIGVGVARNADGTMYWTQLFGAT